MMMSMPASGGPEFAFLGGLVRQVAGLPAAPQAEVPAAEEYAELVRVYRQRFRLGGAPEMDQVLEWQRLVGRHRSGGGRCQKCVGACRYAEPVRTAQAALDAWVLIGQLADEVADWVGER
jgi:hypothetical protein